MTAERANECKVIAVAIQKGGQGKTSCTMNLAVGLARNGYRVLCIDADCQGSLSISFGYSEPDSMDITLASIMTKIIREQEISKGEGIRHHEEGIDLLPCNIELATVELELVATMSREFMMKEYIESVRDDYDYIIIDCSPYLGLMTMNAFVAADSIIIPVQASYLPYKGLEQLLKIIIRVRKRLNPKIEIEGILLNMVDSRTNNTKEIIKNIREKYGEAINIFASRIPRVVKVEEAPRFGRSIYKHSPRCKASKAYEELTDEIIGRR